MFNLLSTHGGVCAPQGFFASGTHVGLKPEGKLDVAYIYSEHPCKVETVFTTNRFQAAPIKHFQEYGPEAESNFILINAKNANALTGAAGKADIEDIFHILKNKFTRAYNPIMSSTGVIGVRLPKTKIMSAFHQFDFDEKEGNKAAEAIMTTDAYPKEVAFEVQTGDKTFRIGAMAKGAGMINPEMATMLCFITTDADVPREDMRELLKRHTSSTFNAISVDGDTSTNDSVFLFANGLSGYYDRDAFSEALRQVMQKLALDIVTDGEGATKQVAFEVSGAKDDTEAEKAAKALSNSLLVKTALFGQDPNWGRIASTIGASGVSCSEDTLTITFGEITVYDKGEIFFDREIEEKAAKVMQQESFRITCHLGQGEGHFVAYGCDLGHEYVKINADYRT